MKRIVFLYDKLMLASEQQLANISAKLLSYATVNGKMYWFVERKYWENAQQKKKKRIFMLPKSSTRNVFGALYEVDNFDEYEKNFYSYYYSMYPFTGEISKEDLFVSEKLTAIPIKFKTLSSLETSKYKRGKPVECIAFVGNLYNEVIKYNSERNYYLLQGIDKNNFINLVKEQQRREKK